MKTRKVKEKDVLPTEIYVPAEEDTDDPLFFTEKDILDEEVFPSEDLPQIFDVYVYVRTVTISNVRTIKDMTTKK